MSDFDLAKDLHRRIESFKTLPIHESVAFRLLELGKNADAGIDEYARLVQLDTGLSSKVLGLINSSWFGMEHNGTDVKHAVSLLGTTNVRALGISHYLAGIRTSLGLEAEDARAYWETSLCKAKAAELLAQSIIGDRSCEAFSMGLFQDIGLLFMAATAGQDFIQLLRNPGMVLARQLQEERSRFGIDHGQCGALVGEKLGLQEPYLSAIKFHHEEKTLMVQLKNRSLAQAVYGASLVPHDLRGWKAESSLALGRFIEKHFYDRWKSYSSFIKDLEKGFSDLVAMLSHGSAEAKSLTELMEEACAENAQLSATFVQDRLHATRQGIEPKDHHQHVTGERK